jgi:hypothetical protein
MKEHDHDEQGEMERLRLPQKVIERRFTLVRIAEIMGVTDLTDRHVSMVLGNVREKGTEHCPPYS